MNAFQVVKDFERELCNYTGAPYAVTTSSCTMALLLAVAWMLQQGDPDHQKFWWHMRHHPSNRSIYLPTVEIPKRTYISVPMSIIHAGGWPMFRDEYWRGVYQLKPLPVWDSARWLTQGMFHDFRPTAFVCLSFHWSKTLGIQQGGAILHDSPEADTWLHRARFDGRAEGVAPKDDHFDMIGWHAYMSPEIAAAGLVRLSRLPRHNDPLPNDEYPDLSLMECFR